MDRKWHFLGLGFVLGMTALCASFVGGMYFQHKDAKRRLQEIIQKDPYAYYVGPKIYEVFCFFENQANADHRMSQIMKYGFPGLDDLRLYSDFVLSYDRRNRVAHWVCEHLQLDNIHSNRGGRGRNPYQPDMSVPSNFRSELTDYRRSGFDRGHLAAAGNHHLQQNHCQDTFFLTNIAPQIGQGFNRGAWNNLERYVRNLVQRFGSVYVCTGPLYKPKQRSGGKLAVEYEMIGQNMVAVPTHFFKVIMVESTLQLGKPYMEGYVLPNAAIPDNLPLRSFLCDIREIEHYAGLKFFDGLRRSAIFGSNYPSESQVFREFG
ncbi:endonuclease G, mitochondrial isoform X1 [Drosophila elegans]|uniref:endonuclease G, mitochondrial isoform X1 n=1 Tax=Drosophila elegans TaxID=30023 RepID=UPI0007E88393|nr:endonuclease G, mitochondrial isoform X1 [Drosophila elegans]